MKAKDWNGQEAKYAHVKYDGIQCRLADRTSRAGNPLDIEWMGLPHADVWGELWIPGHPASDVKTAIKERWDTLRFTAFCSPAFDANLGLHNLEMLIAGFGLDFAKWYKTPECKNMDDFVEGLMDNREPDWEGFVLKDGNMLNWYKVKDIRSADLKCVGFTEGRGKHIGLIGSIICEDATGRVVCNAGGMTDRQRIMIGDDEDSYIGRILEVEYQYVGSGGKLRHPRFIRWRDDKTIPETI